MLKNYSLDDMKEKLIAVYFVHFITHKAINDEKYIIMFFTKQTQIKYPIVTINSS